LSLLPMRAALRNNRAIACVYSISGATAGRFLADARIGFRSRAPQQTMESFGMTTMSRRHLLGAASVAAGAFGSAAFVSHALADAPSKAPKSAVGYQGEPRGDQSCSHCSNFVPPSDCKVVASPVAPAAWCRLYQAKYPAG
jgi:hypothetical protein